MYNTHNCDVRMVFENLSETEAFEKEKELIAHYRKNFPKYRLTNQTDGGEGVSGWIASTEYRELMREKNLGEGNPNYGNKWSDEQKQHLSKVRKERGLAKGEKNVTAKSVMCVETGEIYNIVKDALEKYSIKTHGSITVALKNPERTAGGFHWVTGEDLKKLSVESERKKYLETLKPATPYSIELVCEETNEKYQSIIALANILNISRNEISSSLKKHGKFTYNHKTYSKTNNSRNI